MYRGLLLCYFPLLTARRRAKYGLSVVNHFLETQSENKSALAVDIGCSFKQTISSSQLVGPMAAERQLYVLVNAFHGWAHNRTCQLRHHPLYTPGIGIEDLEGMERLFSWTNHAASTVRGASRYHWLQAYDLCLKQWDEDKYSTLCKDVSFPLDQTLTYPSFHFCSRVPPQ